MNRKQSRQERQRGNNMFCRVYKDVHHIFDDVDDDDND